MNTKLLSLMLALAPAANAATVLEYDVEGRCQTDFSKMVFDGLQARIDNEMEGQSMSTVFDDSEQLVYLLMHNEKQVMTMESDDEAIDFQSDVGRSTMLYSSNQMEKLTGMSMADVMAQAQAAQASMCPELAGKGMSDPDYADAAAKCSQRSQGAPNASNAQMQEQLMAAMASQGAGGKRGKAGTRGLAGGMPAAEPARWSTTQVDRDGGTKSIAGFECTMETTRRGDEVLREQCVVPVESVGLDASAMRRLKRIVKVGEGMSAGISSLNPEANPEAGQPAKLVVERTCHEGGKRTGVATLRIDRAAQVAESLFAVPPGYQPLTLEMPDGRN